TCLSVRATQDRFLTSFGKHWKEDSDEPRVLLIALRHIAEARGGIAKIAKAAGVERESLYRALSPRGNPRLSTLLAVTKAMGLTLTVEAGQIAQLSQRRGGRPSPHPPLPALPWGADDRVQVQALVSKLLAEGTTSADEIVRVSRQVAAAALALSANTVLDAFVLQHVPNPRVLEHFQRRNAFGMSLRPFSIRSLRMITSVTPAGHVVRYASCSVLVVRQSPG
ncbi:putative addiction module antidote protein, partial [Lacticaseibacillus rhamnosus]